MPTMQLSELRSRRLRFDRPVAELTDEELDRHMDITHDRDSGERGLNFNTSPPSLRRSSAVRVHEQLHRTGTWSEIPHTHGRTLPFNPWIERLRRRLWYWRYRFTHIKREKLQPMSESSDKAG